ncbi:MAG TPA: hypothetical protein VFZ95_09120 [Steroidobacteraceae bacterium]
MRRLTLILSDLYLPEESARGELPRIQELPQLSWLLSRAREPEAVGDWRSWLLRQIGGPMAQRPLATLCASERLGDADIENAWLATPVALEARLDHVRMKDRGLLYIDVDERRAWCAEFNRVFGPQYLLHDGGERAFILSGALPTTHTVDPARLLGDEIGPALPGADAPELRRLGAEIEMWLHGSALNEARERAREPRLSSLWVWGRNAAVQASPGTEAREVELHGGDPLLCALGRAWHSPVRATPSGFAQVDTRRAHVLAEFAVLTGSAHESLAELDPNWFAAARHALARGALSQLEIVANDRCFRITPHAHWRFWRAHRGWLENLARPAGSPQV